MTKVCSCVVNKSHSSGGMVVVEIVGCEIKRIVFVVSFPFFFGARWNEKNELEEFFLRSGILNVVDGAKERNS